VSDLDGAYEDLLKQHTPECESHYCFIVCMRCHSQLAGNPETWKKLADIGTTHGTRHSQWLAHRMRALR